MKKLSVLFILLAILLAGCEQGEPEYHDPYDTDVASIVLVQEA